MPRLGKIARHLKEADPILGAIILKDLLPLESKRTVYEQLLSSIISQQISLKAAEAIQKRFLGVYKNTFPSPKKLLATSEETLRTAGLSPQKASYLKSVATHFLERKLDKKDFHTMTKEEVMEALLPIKGVGTWTVEMILMFTIKHPDIFSVKDIGLINPMIKLYNLKKTKTLSKRLLTISEKWAPYRTSACRYLWNYKDGK